MIFYDEYGVALSKEYIQWAIWAYDNGYLSWRHMNDATMDVVEHELRKRKRRKRAQEDEARYQKKVARIQKVETWISSFDTFHTLTEITVDQQKLPEAIAPIVPPPPPLKPAAPMLSLPDDLVPNIILKETTKHKDEDFSPPIDTFDSGPIWDKEEKEKLPKAVLVFTPPKKEILPSTGIRSILSSLATPWMDATPYIASLVPHFFQRPEVHPLERLADSRWNPFKGGEDGAVSVDV